MNLKEELKELLRRSDRFESNYQGNYVTSGFDALKRDYIGKPLDKFLFDSGMGCDDFELRAGEKKFRLKDYYNVYMYTMTFDENKTILSFNREKIDIKW